MYVYLFHSTTPLALTAYHIFGLHAVLIRCDLETIGVKALDADDPGAGPSMPDPEDNRDRDGGEARTVKAYCAWSC